MVDYQQKQQGERLKFLRVKLGKTQKEFAQSLEIAQSYVSAIEQGDRGISSGVTNTILESYPNVNIDWLLAGRGNPLNDSLTLQSTGNLPSEPGDLVQVSGVFEVNDAPQRYQSSEEEVQFLRMRINELELFISQKFPDFKPGQSLK